MNENENAIYLACLSEFTDGTVHCGLRADWVWTVHEHNTAPAAFKRMVHTLLLVRTFELSSAFSLIPNELLFLILAFTPPF